MNRNKFLASILVALALSTTATPLAAFADDTNPTDTIQEEQRVDYVQGLKEITAFQNLSRDDRNAILDSELADSNMTASQMQQDDNILMRGSTDGSTTRIPGVVSRGVKGMAAKAAVTVIRIALRKMGRRTYENIARRSGLSLVKLNWDGINWLLNTIANSDEQFENAFRKAMIKSGMNPTAAAMTAKIIVTIFF